MGEITYPINEIFRSIQGEGYHSGRVAVFVRFSGCQLRCEFCDTDHSAKEQLTAQQIRDRVTEEMLPGGDLIVLTGGEPTLHPLLPLIDFWSPLQVAIETNGVLWQPLRAIKQTYPGTWITVSPKAPAPRYKSFQYADEIKVVWDSKLDMNKINANLPADIRQRQRVYLQPCSMNVLPALEYVMSHPWWRLSLQIHKMIGAR